MPLYAGNLYNQNQATEVAVNTQKAKPSSLFGTRQLKFFSFSMYWCLYTNTNNLEDNALSVTGGTSDGKQVTFEFDAQLTTPYAVGDTIFVYGMDSQHFNGEFAVVAATSTSVTVDWFRTGSSVTGGSIVRVAYNDPDSAYSYIVRAIQKVAEIYYLGRPSYQNLGYSGPGSSDFGSFVFAISDELTTTDYDELGFDQPEEGHDVGENSKPTDLASALKDALNAYTSPHTFWDWGSNGDGWSVSVLDDLGWGFAPGLLAGDPGFGLINGQYSTPPSDRRLKRNITLLETRNDINIYSFQYLWSEEYFVGVMAQDLLGTDYESAVIEKNGFYTVDYSQLGFDMQLLSDYNTLTV